MREGFVKRRVGQTERTWGRRFRLPTAGSNQELAGESACPTSFVNFRGPKAHPNSRHTPIVCPTSGLWLMRGWHMMTVTT
jgi:hypothetical protein